MLLTHYDSLEYTGSGPSDAISCGKRTDDVPLFFVPGDASPKGPKRLHFEDAVTGTCVVGEECPAAHWANLGKSSRAAETAPAISSLICFSPSQRTTPAHPAMLAN